MEVLNRTSPGQNEMHSLLVLVATYSRDAYSAGPPVKCVCAPLTCSFYKKEREKHRGRIFLHNLPT